MEESGTARARSYRKASDDEREHLLKHITLGFAGDEVVIGYGIAKCDDGEKCKFPHTTVTMRVCPSCPC